MKFGLNDSEIDLISSVFRRHPEIHAVRIFGSRALGTSRPNSDIDLALYGDIDDSQHRSISSELDELPLPYLFDTVVYGRITHNDLRRHVDLYGEVIHEDD